MNMKTIGRKLLLAAAALLCCAGICLVSAAPAQAASKSANYSWDLDGNGTKETCVATSQYDKYEYITSFKITDNGSTIYSKNISSYDCMTLKCSWIRLTTNLNFVQIYGVGEDDYTMFNWIFRYDTSSKKLALAGNMSTYYGEAYDASKVSSNTITVSMGTQPAKLGWLTWNLNYKYNASTGKFALVSPYASVKSLLGTRSSSSYTKYFAKNQFKTIRTLTFYKTPGSTTKSFSVARGKWVSLTRIRVSHGKAYYEFRYKSGSTYKYGWLGGLEPYSNQYFADVANWLAG